jgi:hypothetical protein
LIAVKGGFTWVLERLLEAFPRTVFEFPADGVSSIGKSRDPGVHAASIHEDNVVFSGLGHHGPEVSRGTREPVPDRFVFHTKRVQ